MINKTEIRINQDDLIFIFGEEIDDFTQKIVANCYCANCSPSYRSTIINYQIFLNDLDDIILKGICARCGHKVNRYIETGEVAKYLKRINEVKKRYIN